MAGRTSAGLLVYRRARERGVEFLLVHPGGPFWRNRDEGAWSIPKGLVDPGEDQLVAAVREFAEEVGQAVEGDFMPLAPLKQKGGKTVLCWTVEADLDLSKFKSNECQVEWPPRSGRMIRVPECDRAAYFAPDEARAKLLAGQRGFVDEAMRRLGPANANGGVGPLTRSGARRSD